MGWRRRDWKQQLVQMLRLTYILVFAQKHLGFKCLKYICLNGKWGCDTCHDFWSSVYIFNQISELESHVAKLRSQLEKGEATRQNLEFELTKCQREINHQRNAAYDKESHLGEIKDQLQGSSLSFTQVKIFPRYMEKNKCWLWF